VSVRILFTRFPLESAFGGAEVQTLSLMEGLRARGHEVSFLGSCPVLLEKLREAGFAALRLEIGPPPVRADLAVSFLWRAPHMRQQIKTAFLNLPKPDVVCMLSLSEKLLLTDWFADHGTDVFWIEHDRLGRWLTGNPWLLRLRQVARRAVTVCVSELSRRRYLALGWPKARTVTIGNGVDLAPLEAIPLPPARTGPLQVSCIARLTRDKGVDILVDAIAGLPEVALTLVGTGRDEDLVRDHIAAARARSSEIVLISPPVDTALFLAGQDVLVLPSRDHDPFGLVAAEAMAAGRAVIVTDECGIAGELRDGIDALIVPAGDISLLRKAVVRLRDDDELRLRLSATARETACERFGAAAMVAAYEALLTKTH
jgi:glycosyltransferase involved in cell wall biosynthesis